MYEDLRDLAEQAADPDLSNDDYCDLRDLAAQFDPNAPKTHAGPVTDDEREHVARILADAADNEPTMIPVCDFTEYARELAEDIGAISRETQWPFCAIDWEQAALDLSMDYTEVTYAGTDYYTRAY